MIRGIWPDLSGPKEQDRMLRTYFSKDLIIFSQLHDLAVRNSWGSHIEESVSKLPINDDKRFGAEC